MTALAFNRDHQATFWARAHMESDAGIREVWHLPQGADEREVRLLEVNDSLSEFVDDCLEAVEFGIDRGMDTHHQLLVLDVTPDQWARIKAKQLSLPGGWGLESSAPLGVRAQSVAE